MSAGCGISVTVSQPGMSAAVSESTVLVSAPTPTILVQADPCGEGGSVFCRKAVFAVTSAAIAVGVAAAIISAVASSPAIQVSANVGYRGPAGPTGTSEVKAQAEYGAAFVRGQIVYLQDGVAYPVTNAMPESVLYLLGLVLATGALGVTGQMLLSGLFTDDSLALLPGRVYLGSDGFPHGVDDPSGYYVPVGHSDGGDRFFFSPRERYIR